jgi:hypothetical protein
VREDDGVVLLLVQLPVGPIRQFAVRNPLPARQFEVAQIEQFEVAVFGPRVVLVPQMTMFERHGSVFSLIRSMVN